MIGKSRITSEKRFWHFENSRYKSLRLALFSKCRDLNCFMIDPNDPREEIFQHIQSPHSGIKLSFLPPASKMARLLSSLNIHGHLQSVDRTALHQLQNN